MAVRTRDKTLRYPDITVDCGSSEDVPSDHFFSNPHVIIEILSPSTRDYDLRIKRDEYRGIGSIDTIVFVDLDARTLIVDQRIPGRRTEMSFPDTTDIHLPALSLTVPHSEIFADH